MRCARGRDNVHVSPRKNHIAQLVEFNEVRRYSDRSGRILHEIQQVRPAFRQFPGVHVLVIFGPLPESVYEFLIRGIRFEIYIIESVDRIILLVLDYFIRVQFVLAPGNLGAVSENYLLPALDYIHGPAGDAGLGFLGSHKRGRCQKNQEKQYE
jgi:hypothetical protein